IDTPEQRGIARKAADESVVLLKNEGGILPLDAGKVKSIAVIGPNAAVARTGGGGSSKVKSSYTVAPLAAITEKAGSRIQVEYALGAPEPAAPAEKKTPEARKQLLDEAVAAAQKAD